MRPLPDNDLPALASALNQSQIEIEAEKSALARTLHDDLGGLLVGAIMDLGWIATQPGLADTVKEKAARAQGLLRAAIDMKRNLIENLRPTLLDNVGLYPTLRWHMKASCGAASVPYTETFPNTEQAMTAEIKIGVFRIFQEALKDILQTPEPTDLSLTVEVVGDTLHCHLSHRSAAHLLHTETARASQAAMHHRAERISGTVQWSETICGGRHMHLHVPLPPVDISN